jgi:fumarylacetoacetate (FAA) hydrolase family protein
MNLSLENASALPFDHERAVLIGRAWVEGHGPVLVRVREDGLYDLSSVAPTCSALLEMADPVDMVRECAGGRIAATTAEVLANTSHAMRNPAQPWFLAPCDLQAIKAAGVTFAASLVERVIEEQARGDASRAESVRKAVAAAIGDNLGKVRPGSAQAAQLKETLIAQGVWSQYLEVGIGPDAEVFTKAQALSAVGTGAEVGILAHSEWNNPEPEIVLAVNSRGEVKGASLGNDVNLRDIEGRSALLLGKAKDNNASCAIGPFIRLFDEHFGIDDVRQCEVTLQVHGQEGFTLNGVSPLSQISRDPLDLVQQTSGPHHQYPDGFMLFLGTMFAPTQDRFGPGQGFTHAVGDVVTVHTPLLGTLANRVNHSDKITPWTYGISALMYDLARRGLLS